MERDLDDTVIGPPRPLPPGEVDDDSDTILRRRAPKTDPAEQASSVASARPDTAPVDQAPIDQARVGPQYAFRVNTSELIGLERPAYIGRNPSPPRVIDEIRPRLVRVPSALGEVSGTHLELRQQGGVVIATDLKSTNGTRVRIPGSAPVRLRQNESIVVSPGSVIEIGDDNVIEVLATRRVHSPGQIPGAAHS